MLARRTLGLGAAALAMTTLAPGRAGAQRPYRPGSGLEIAAVTRPGQGSVNSFVLVGERSLVVLDCQRTGVEARQVAAHARGIGLPVEAIILSHEHPDHVAGLEVLTRAFPDATVMASEGTRDWIARNGRDLLGTMRGLFGAAMPETIPLPTRILRQGEMLRLAGAEWRVEQLGPGEAGGMTMLHAEAEDVLFAADLFGSRATPYLLDGHANAWIAQLEAAMPRFGHIGTALPGHGSAAPAGALIAAQLDYLRAFAGIVRAEAASGLPLADAALARVRRATEERFPGLPFVSPQPNLIELNAQSFARELAAR